jgi:hypothetical protein
MLVCQLESGREVIMGLGPKLNFDVDGYFMASLRKPHLQASLSNPQLIEVADFTHAVEIVFRKLIRLLIGKISLKKLQEMIQIIFVEEAEEKLKQEAPGKNVPLSTLAVVSGLDTRTLSRIKAEESFNKPFHKTERFLSEITPECSILDVWESNPKYRDLKSGKPKALAIRGLKNSFESLIYEIGLTRGVSVTSFLKRLEASKSIVVDKAGNSVRMINKRYTPFGSVDQTENAKVGLAAIGNLLDTILHNLNAGPKNEESFYQQGSWTNRLDKNESRKFRKLVKKFLSESDERARKIMRPFEQGVVSNNQITAGISMFYFEEEPGN